METYLLAIQARVLQWAGLACIALGFWAGVDPLDIAWRTALGALVAMLVAGWLLRRVWRVIEERATQELAERQAVQPQPGPTTLAPTTGART